MSDLQKKYSTKLRLKKNYLKINIDKKKNYSKCL